MDKGAMKEPVTSTPAWDELPAGDLSALRLQGCDVHAVRQAMALLREAPGPAVQPQDRHDSRGHRT